MHIAIVDDERYEQDRIHDLLNKELESFHLKDVTFDIFDSGDAFFAVYPEKKFDLIILDIYLKNELGIDIGKRIREIDDEVTIVFCTTSNEFASQSYAMDAKYYLHKPVDASTVHNMMVRINPRLVEEQQRIELPDNYTCRLKSIMYTSYHNHRITFNLSNSVTHTVYMSHMDAEDLLLSHEGFYTINKGMIVNFGMVKNIDSQTFVMKDDSVLPIARRRFKEVKEAYLQYRITMM